MDDQQPKYFLTDQSMNSSSERKDPFQQFDQESTVRCSVEDRSQPTGLKEIIQKWPKVTFCIICNEFCERFSFYGMRAVLTLYVINILAFSSTNATILFHAFVVLSYTSPLLGSTLADGYIGKFWTIFSLSLLYAAGQIILSISSTFHTSSSVHPALDIVGLIIIGIGTGGIKPCVSAFGGDQFNPRYTVMISIFFSVFYFTINAGSTISIFVTPLFRAIPCNGQDSCYPMAFGVPAALMILATVFFMLGTKHYKKYPPKENVIFRVVIVVVEALKNKTRSKLNRDHWLEHYLDTHQCQADKNCIALMNKKSSKNECAQKAFVEDVKALLRVIVMLMPVPMFWALYDQQGSKWIVQAVSMNSQITPSFSLLPDQMGTMNAILIMIFIPIFQFIIYPTVQKLGIRTTPLRRMVAGGVLGSLAFVICAIVQFRINQTLPEIPQPGTSFVSFVNLYDGCAATLRSPNLPTRTIAFNSSLLDDKVNGAQDNYRINVDNAKNVTFELSFDEACSYPSSRFTMRLRGGQSYYGILSPQGFVYNRASLVKPTSGQQQSSVNINLLVPCSSVSKAVDWGSCNNRIKSQIYSDGIALCKYNKNSQSLCNPDEPASFFAWSTSDTKSISNATFYSFKDVNVGTYGVYYIHYNRTDSGRRSSSNQLIAIPMDGVTVNINGMGAVYSLTIQPTVEDGDQSKRLEWNMLTLVAANNVSILWQIPQYIVITAAEILISITGLEFAYSQAAPALKSVVQAIWLLTVAFGDIIIIIIELLDLFHNLAIEMLVYAAVMMVVIIIFALLAIFYYKYVDFADEQEDALIENQLS